MTNVIALFTPGPQHQMARYTVPLAEPMLFRCHQDIASLAMHREGDELAVYHMALGVPQSRLVVQPGDCIRVVLGNTELTIVVRAVSATHVIADVGKDPAADVALILLSA